MTRSRAEYQREWRRNNLDKVAGYARTYKRKNPDKSKEWQRASYHRHKETAYRWRLMRYYKLTFAQYEAMLEAQDGGCAICGGVDTMGRRMSVDHDRSCCPGTTSCGNCVRALLCGHCNHGLGKFQDSPEVLNKAIDYLNHWRSEHSRTKAPEDEGGERTL